MIWLLAQARNPSWGRWFTYLSVAALVLTLSLSQAGCAEKQDRGESSPWLLAMRLLHDTGSEWLEAVAQFRGTELSEQAQVRTILARSKNIDARLVVTFLNTRITRPEEIDRLEASIVESITGGMINILGHRMLGLEFGSALASDRELASVFAGELCLKRTDIRLDIRLVALGYLRNNDESAYLVRYFLRECPDLYVDRLKDKIANIYLATNDQRIIDLLLERHERLKADDQRSRMYDGTIYLNILRRCGDIAALRALLRIRDRERERYSQQNLAPWEDFDQRSITIQIIQERQVLDHLLLLQYRFGEKRVSEEEIRAQMVVIEKLQRQSNARGYWAQLQRCINHLVDLTGVPAD